MLQGSFLHKKEPGYKARVWDQESTSPNGVSADSTYLTCSRRKKINLTLILLTVSVWHEGMTKQTWAIRYPNTCPITDHMLIIMFGHTLLYLSYFAWRAQLGFFLLQSHPPKSKAFPPSGQPYGTHCESIKWVTTVH